MPHPFAQQFAAAQADEAEFGPITCEGCDTHMNSDDDLREVDGKFLCEDCDTTSCTCQEVDVDAPGPMGPCTTILCENCEPKWTPKTLTDVAVRRFGLRENGARI